MIFDRLISLRISLDMYKNSKNLLKKIMYKKLYKDFINKISIIKSIVLDYDLLFEFVDFVNIADSNNISNIKANTYNYSNTFARDIIIKNNYGSLCIILKDDKYIEIKYPLSENVRVNKIYNNRLQDLKENDKNTIIINDSIRNSIYDFIISYMKGEFDETN
jgi:hypothetical protein